MSQKTPHYLAIDEEGFPLTGEIRVTDPDIGSQLLKSIQFAENGAFKTKWGDEEAYVEAFDEPLVIQRVEAPVEVPANVIQGKFNSEKGFVEQKNLWQIWAPYNSEFSFKLDSLTLDEWDRFHGLTTTGIPFVFSRKAQAQFFELLEEFDDDSITYKGQRFAVKPWLPLRKDVHSEEYWSQIYRTEEPGWELGRPAPALLDMLPRLKLPRSKVLILGCGSGNDAAHFAENGHVVTAVDISNEALERGKKKYGHLNINWIQSDLFKLGTEHTHQYDVIFEHTCYCAMNPGERNDLVKTWLRLLAPGGHLMGVFFTMERRSDPPFGGSEWELRERLKKYFQFIFWGRWKQSLGRREGKELFVYAQKK